MNFCSYQFLIFRIMMVAIHWSLLHCCIAFPMQRAQTSRRSHASRHHHSLDGFAATVAIPDLQIPMNESIGEQRSKRVGLWSKITQRHLEHHLKNARNNQNLPITHPEVHPYLGMRKKMTNQVGKFVSRAIHRLRGKQLYNHNTIGSSASTILRSSPIHGGRRFRLSSFSKRNHVRHKSNTLDVTKLLGISKVQSLAVSSTALNMVLSTPDTIIEQVSTQKLLDALIDESVRTSSREPVMMQFNPKRGWIWRQWRGTVFSETWKSGLLNMALAAFVVVLYRIYPNLKDLLEGFSILWGQLLSVTTFTLTFFLNQSYGLWRKCYDYSRRLQGRLNDLGMTLAAHATRVTPSSPDIPSTYTPQSRQALELVSRYVRVFNLLTYASFTRSHRPILTPRGMRRLVERGILTQKEREILIEAEIPATQRHNAVLVWLIRLFLEGRQTGVFEGGYGFEEQFMEKCHVIRAQYGAIGDELQGRMPLAYAHIVQVLLDVVLWMYPFMALSTGMAWYISVIGTGLLTMFYQGLFDLAKQFLDPYDNENYGKGDDPLVIDTLIAETNSGSVRWMNSFHQQPWNKQQLKDGEMYDSLLPLRGYSVEELLEKEAQEEEERKERERMVKERKLKEEEKEREHAKKLLLESFELMQNGTSLLMNKSNGTAILSPRAGTLMSKGRDIDFRNKTLLEVSGGHVIARSTLFPSRTVFERSSNMVETSNDVESVAGKTNATLSPAISHKVLTLDDGTIVTQDDIDFMYTDPDSSQPRSDVGFDVLPAPVVATPLVSRDAIRAETSNLDTSGVNENSFQAEPFDVESSPEKEYINAFSSDENDPDLLTSEDFDYDDADFDPFEIEWFQEVGPDGKEYRLSQMLADEDWEYLNDSYEIVDSSENKTMEYGEFTRTATGVMEEAENELLETAEIMSSSPGSQAEYDAKKRDPSTAPIALTKRKTTVEEKEPLYDQTLLDPISQLWGAPPGVLQIRTFDDESEPRTINEDLDFANIYSLWGMPIESKAAVAEDEEVCSPPIDGIRQLWNDEALFVPDTLDSDPTNNSISSSDDVSLYTGLEWWDKVSEDGKEYRLSMMLADEEYEEEAEEEVDRQPMTYEQFALETENMIQQVEDERKETQAIMNAPPNANFLEDDDLDESSTAIFAAVAASDKFEEMVMSLSEGEVGFDIIDENRTKYDDDIISLLEMDVDSADPPTNSSVASISKETLHTILGANNE